MRNAVLVLAAAASAVAASLRIVGVANTTQPAFTTLVDVGSPGGAPSVLISQFTGNPLAKDSLKLVPSIGKAFSSGTFAGVSADTVLENITWPNTVHPADPSLAGSGGMLVSGGFLVPPKSVGAVHVVGLSDASGTPDVTTFAKLTTDKGNPLFDGWFYHMAVSVDMNGDGLKDVLTARATKPLLGASGGEMIWLERPAGADPLAPAALPWKEHSLASGKFAPDVFFALQDLDGDGLFEIVYTTFFSEGGGSVSVLYTEGDTTPARWTNSSAVKRVTIDTSLGTMFGVTAADLNGDGRSDFLVTNHVDNATLSGVYAYVTPSDGDFADASKWQRHTLAAGFPTRIPGPGQASPGLALAVHPRTDGKGKPAVVVAGDGEERFHLLEPLSASQSDWTYNRTVVFDCKGTVGAPVVGDTDGDGWSDVVLPCYDIGKLVGLTFKP